MGPTIRERLRALGCDIDWLMTGKTREGEEQAGPDLSFTTQIPVIGKAIANPNGKEYFEEFSEPITWPFFKGNYFGVIIEGDSLIQAPVSPNSRPLYPGDLAIFEQFKQPVNGNIVCVELKQKGQRLVKLLKHKGRDEVMLESANNFRNYPGFVVPKEDIASFGIFVARFELVDSIKKKFGLKE
jgi:SOS-response transcriptional repressor LexA